MNIIGTILLIVLLAGGFYFAYWAISRVLTDESGRNRRQRRGSPRRKT